MYQASDIVLLPFPYSDLSASKKRPVLILKTPNQHGDFLAIQITSQAGFDNALVLQQQDFALGLLPKISFARPDKLVTLSTSLIVQRMGKLSDSAFARIQQANCLTMNFGQ